MGLKRGILWSILVGALFLPEAIEYDLPGLPPLEKNSSIVLGLLMGYLSSRSRPGKQAELVTNVADPFAHRVILGLTGLFLLSGFLTVLNNAEPIVDGAGWIKGLDIRDLITMTAQTVFILVPYFLAQRFLSEPEAHRDLLRAFVIAGLGYSLLILFEARMSPQLHIWTYGYFQHSWYQHVRGGQFRPIVFQPHGIWIGILVLTCTMSAFVLLKDKVRKAGRTVQYLLAGFWLAAVLVISLNFGALLLAFVFVPVLWFCRVRLQIWIAAGIMATFLVFPALRQSEVVTLESVADLAGYFSVERQQSLLYRLDFEQKFLERAALKPLTGWGIWARWRIRNAETGADESTADGLWIIVLGERGWIGYIAYFGLLTAPSLLLLRGRKRQESVPRATAGMSLIMAAVISYQVPNDTIGPMTLIIAGALAGYAVKRASLQPADPTQRAQESPRATTYTRFPPIKSRPAARQVSAKRFLV